MNDTILYQLQKDSNIDYPHDYCFFYHFSYQISYDYHSYFSPSFIKNSNQYSYAVGDSPCFGIDMSPDFQNYHLRGSVHLGLCVDQA